MKNIAAGTIVALALLPAISFAEEGAAPAQATGPQQPQGVFIPYADLQGLMTMLGEVPMKYAEPIAQAMQQIVQKNQPRPTPPAAPAPKKAEK